MLGTKRLVGVTSEVNLSELISCIPLPSVIRMSTLALKPGGDITRTSKQVYQWPHKKDLCPPKIFKKKILSQNGYSTEVFA